MVTGYLFRDFDVLLHGATITRHHAFNDYKAHEQETVEFLYKRIMERPRATLIDVGAHIGVFCLLAAYCKNLTVYAVEPLVDVHHTLQENLFLNDIAEQVYIIPEALSGDTRKVSFICDRVNTYHSCIEPPVSYLVEEPRVYVNTMPLDEMVMEHQITRVDFIKIDTEGHELQVLKGARETILRHTPDLLVECDVEGLGRFGTNQEEVTRYLEGLGYSYKKQLNGADAYFSTKEIP